MKKHLLVFFSIITIIQTKAQLPVAFCPPGAEWHYNYRPFFSPASGNYRVKYVRDSIVDAETVKVIAHPFFFAYCDMNTGPFTLIRQKGDTIFMRNAATQHNWQVLYNFAAQPGQSWVDSLVNAQYKAYYVTQVDSIRYATVNNFLLKRLYVTQKRCNPNLVPYVSFSLSITDRIGYDGNYLFNFEADGGGCDALLFMRFLCYRDNTIGVVQFGPEACDYAEYVGLEELNKSGGINIYPNPAQRFLNLETAYPGEELQLQLTDVYGWLLLQQKLGSAESKHTVDLENLGPGVYMLSVMKDKKLVYQNKLIKQQP